MISCDAERKSHFPPPPHLTLQSSKWMSDLGLLLIALIVLLPLIITLIVQSAVDPLHYVIRSEDLDDRQVSTLSTEYDYCHVFISIHSLL